MLIFVGLPLFDYRAHLRFGLRARLAADNKNSDNKKTSRNSHGNLRLALVETFCGD
jgi:hypothetical protein